METLLGIFMLLVAICFYLLAFAVNRKNPDILNLNYLPQLPFFDNLILVLLDILDVKNKHLVFKVVYFMLGSLFLLGGIIFVI